MKTQKNLKTPTADKFTKLEKSWIGYDIGNSAFTLLATTIMPLFFNAIAEAAEISPADSFAYWGLATSITTLIVAVLGPILGAIADPPVQRKNCLWVRSFSAYWPWPLWFYRSVGLVSWYCLSLPGSDISRA